MPAVRDVWRRFWALSWGLRSLALGLAVLAPSALIALVMVATGGSGEGDHPQPTASPTSPLPHADPAESGYRLTRTIEAANFDQMLGFAAVPGAEDKAVVLTQGGVIWLVSLRGAFQPTIYGDLRDRLIGEPSNEEGLLGLAFSPRFQSDSRAYVFYTAGDPRRSVLSWFRVSNGTMDMASERVVLEIPQPFARHNGGQLVFGPDGYLYLSVGDGGLFYDPQGNGQNLGTLLGSILRLDVSSGGQTIFHVEIPAEGYTIPPDNPFVDTEGARAEIYAYGLRNPWRMSFDRATGEFWAADVGQGRWEEVDRIVPGGNYGWSILEGDECIEAATCDTVGLQPPRAVYSHDVGCAVTGGYVYRGRSMPELTGWYVYGDFCSGNIWAVNTAGGGPPVLLAETGLPIASFAELADGELLAITFANAIFRLERVQ